ncbi:MAG TPA: NADH-ubiquinone oxidoreductase-F iron-sulfur binding region domain-containing protein [Bacteroidales bacterium]|nr:NADH-ubiquinone oxidoreductase-F iron-sulfur binding region domain-containing protein [Bacteroidales bacterium]
MNRETARRIIALPPSKITREEQDLLLLLRRDRCTIPVILVSESRPARVSGSNATYSAIADYISENNLSVELGRCSGKGFQQNEPFVDVQLPGKSRVTFGPVSPEIVPLILDGMINKAIPMEYALWQYRNPMHEPWDGVPFFDEIPYFSGQVRKLTRNFGLSDPASVAEYIARDGYKAFVKAISNYTAADITELVEQSGLRGRGGAGYPTAQKWQVARNTLSDQKYLICNADESDPGAFTDKALLEREPHKVIEGVAIAAYAIGASMVFIYVNASDSYSTDCIEHALSEAAALGLTGENIFDSGFNLKVQLVRSAGAYICGEETALINNLQGKRAIPRQKPPYPSEKGLFGKPTVVNNVETLFNLPDILNYGPQWYRNTGTPDSPGTKILSLTGKLKYQGLVEVPFGITLNDLVTKIGGGIRNGKQFKALQIGGPAGRCIGHEGLQLKLDYKTFAEAGIFLGSGGVVVLDEENCMVDVARYFLRFISRESCGKCIPCREGSRRMLDILNAISHRPEQGASHEPLERFKGVMTLESLAEVIKDTSLCGLGKTAPDTVLSTLRLFREEYEEHIFERKCRAGVCTDLQTYYIDMEACTGCTACAKKCPVNAIIGTPRQPFFIIEQKCTGCGICMETCKFSAVKTR